MGGRYNMLVTNYSYLCGNIIIKRIAELSSDDNIRQNINNFYKNVNIDNNIDIVWALISTSLLMSENMFKNSNSYNLIKNIHIYEIEYTLKNFTKLYPDEKADKPCLLDSLNNPAGAFYEFLEKKPEEEIFVYNDADDNIHISESQFEKEKYYDEIYREREKHYNSMRIDGPFGCNDSIISNGKIDIRLFIKKVRNAIAHSSYEVINNDCIRLFHYKEKGNLDFNITLDKNTVIMIVDSLNEIAYKKFKFIDEYCKNELFLEDELFEKSDINDEDLIKFITQFDIYDINKANIILKQVKKQTMLNDNKLCNNYNLFTSICEIIYEDLIPCCEFGSIINNIIYSSADGRIISDDYFNKYYTYNYLKSDTYKTNYSDKNDTVYKENELKLLILSFLNCSLLATHNDMENNNITLPKINFSKFNIQEEIIMNFEQKHMNNNQNLLQVMRQRIEKINTIINEKQKFIHSSKKSIKNNNINNKYFNFILPEKIKLCELEIESLNQEKENLIIECNNIIENGINYNYQHELSNFIFRSLRNSLAHGFVYITGDLINSFSEASIIFEDYDPYSNKLTFSGKIKVVDLLNFLVKDRDFINLYKNDSVSFCDQDNSKNTTKIYRKKD